MSDSDTKEDTGYRFIGSAEGLGEHDSITVSHAWEPGCKVHNHPDPGFGMLVISSSTEIEIDSEGTTTMVLTFNAEDLLSLALDLQRTASLIHQMHEEPEPIQRTLAIKRFNDERE